MKKVTELTGAKEIKDEDIIMIIQNGENRQVKASSILIHIYTMTITQDIAKRCTSDIAILL